MKAGFVAAQLPSAATIASVVSQTKPRVHGASSLRSQPAGCESLYSVRSARGELKNNPVDCFLRGDALQERASPKHSEFLIRSHLPSGMRGKRGIKANAPAP